MDHSLSVCSLRAASAGASGWRKGLARAQRPEPLLGLGKQKHLQVAVCAPTPAAQQQVVGRPHARVHAVAHSQLAGLRGDKGTDLWPPKGRQARIFECADAQVGRCCAPGR